MPINISVLLVNQLAMASGGTASIQLTIANQDSGEPVSYKQDGKRFASDVTLKFSVDTAYTLGVTLKPAFSKLLLVYTVSLTYTL